jgi:hypothetical protein
MSDTPLLQPLLRNYPDGRKARLPLLHPVLLPYLALIFGGMLAAIVSCYNAAMLKRPGLLFRSLLLGLASWIGFLFVVGALLDAEVSARVAMIAGRAAHFAFGGVLYYIHRPYLRGHEFLGGETAPLLPTYLTAIIASFMAPSSLTLLLLGVPFVR